MTIGKGKKTLIAGISFTGSAATIAILTIVLGFLPNNTNKIKPYDISGLNYQYGALVETELDEDEMDDFLTHSLEETAKFKKVSTLMESENYDFDWNTGKMEHSHYFLDGTSLMYDNKVFTAKLGITDTNEYLEEVRFIRDGYMYEHFVSSVEGLETENCEKETTTVTDLFLDDELTIVEMLKEPYNKSNEFTYGKDEKGNVLAHRSEIVNGTTTIYVTSSEQYNNIDKKEKDQTIVKYEKVGDKYREKEYTWFFETMVKFDYGKKESTSYYKLRSRIRLHLEIEYDTKLGDFDQNLIDKYMAEAKEK